MPNGSLQVSNIETSFSWFFGLLIQNDYIHGITAQSFFHCMVKIQASFSLEKFVKKSVFQCLLEKVNSKYLKIYELEQNDAVARKYGNNCLINFEYQLYNSSVICKYKLSDIKVTTLHQN